MPTSDEPAREPEIATGTLAEIYAQQGLYDRALEIYRRIESRRPGDPAVARRIAALEAARDERADSGETPEAGPTPAMPVAETPPREEATPEEPGADREAEPRRGATFLEDPGAFREWLESR